MTIDIQMNLNKNVYYRKYLREHSEWYKILNRNPNMFKEFEGKLKEDYKLRPTDKIKNTLDTIELIENILTTLK